MSSVVIAGNTSGSVTLAAPDVAGTTTLTLPATSGTVSLNGSAFSAYVSSATQSLTSAVATKVNLDTVEFDTNNLFDTINYRFQPDIAGYYRLSGRVNSGVTSSVFILDIYKNGVLEYRGFDTRVSSPAGQSAQANAIVYLNGTTDYVELYVVITGTSPYIFGTKERAYFQGELIRAD